jgi:hypothetical protein
MTTEQMIEQIIEALHGPPEAPRGLAALWVHAHPDLPAARLPAAFEAAAHAIETMFAHEGRPPHQALRARVLARALAQDIAMIAAEGAPDLAALGAYWATGAGDFPALWREE